MRLVKPHFSCVNNVYKVLLFYGGVPEWFNGAVPKTAVFTGLVSSNLTPSARVRHVMNTWRPVLITGRVLHPPQRKILVEFYYMVWTTYFDNLEIFVKINI